MSIVSLGVHVDWTDWMGISIFVSVGGSLLADGGTMNMQVDPCCLL